MLTLLNQIKQILIHNSTSHTHNTHSNSRPRSNSIKIKIMVKIFQSLHGDFLLLLLLLGFHSHAMQFRLPWHILNLKSTADALLFMLSCLYGQQFFYIKTRTTGKAPAFTFVVDWALRTNYLSIYDWKNGVGDVCCSHTYHKVESVSLPVWRFYWQTLVHEYHDRPPLVPPFIIFSHIYRAFRSCCPCHNSDSCWCKQYNDEFREYG